MAIARYPNQKARIDSGYETSMYIRIPNFTAEKEIQAKATKHVEGHSNVF